MTVFAPTDNAFSTLKLEPTKISNPLRTQARDSGSQLNINTSGNQVNITTSVVDTPVSNTLYTDGTLVVYIVEKVLLPMSLFGPPSPAPAPGPLKKKKADSDTCCPW
ncbi:fasciclin-like arabinogalactan protein 11 [Tanacetum coccineum]